MKNKILKKHPINYTSILKEVNNSSDLTDKWTKIDISNMVTNYAIKLDKIYVYTNGIKKPLFRVMTFNEFDKWRMDCKYPSFEYCPKCKKDSCIFDYNNITSRCLKCGYEYKPWNIKKTTNLKLYKKIYGD